MPSTLIQNSTISRQNYIKIKAMCVYMELRAWDMLLASEADVHLGNGVVEEITGRALGPKAAKVPPVIIESPQPIA